MSKHDQAGQSGVLTLQSDLALQIECTRRAEQQVVESETRYRAIFDNAPVMMHVIDATGRLTRVNRCWLETLGYREDEVIGRSSVDFLTEKCRLHAVFKVADITQHGNALNNIAIRFIHRDGHPVDVVLTAHADHDGHGRVTQVTAVGVEITERIDALRSLQHEKERLRITLASIGEAVITTDADQRVDYVNPAAEALTGWSMDEAVGNPLQTVIERCDLNEGEPVGLSLDAIGQEREPITLLLRHRREQRTVAVELTAAPIKGADDHVFGLVLVIRDVTDARAQSELMAWQANHDPLTGLLNRRAFEERLAQVIARCASNGDHHYVLCFLDLDRFKLVNDSCGHAAGDELLCELTMLIRSTLRDSDVLARLGGDEFAILLENCPLSAAQRITGSIRDTVASYRYRHADRVFSLGVSIGLVSSEESAGTVEGILQAADSACYAAKESGRNRVHVYSSNDGTLQRRQEDTQWVSRLGDALDNDHFELFAQMIEPTDGRSHGGAHLEILLRLRDDDGSLVPPGTFIPVAERFQIMHRLDRWVIDHALGWLADHRDDLSSLGSLAINLSGQSLNEPQFLSFVESRLDQSAVPCEKICFEITETAAIDNVEGAQSVMSALRARGCRFALDDFGSGLSSFAYLRSLPVDYLKIDGLFVRDILDDSIDFAMVRTINDIGQLLGKETIAEYVENDDIQRRLTEVGVDWVQGFGVGKPVPLATLWAEIVADRGNRQAADSRAAA